MQLAQPHEATSTSIPTSRRLSPYSHTTCHPLAEGIITGSKCDTQVTFGINDGVSNIFEYFKNVRSSSKCLRLGPHTISFWPGTGIESRQSHSLYALPLVSWLNYARHSRLSKAQIECLNRLFMRNFFLHTIFGHIEIFPVQHHAWYCLLKCRADVKSEITVSICNIFIPLVKR